MTKYISCAETAKFIRKALKENFPGIKFSVRSNTYSGGASIDVSWVDGPADPAVERVTRFFSGSTFDSSIDLKSYVETEWEGEKVHFGADYIFTRRKMSRTFVETIVAQYCKRYGVSVEVKGNEADAWVNYDGLDYWEERRLSDILKNTDAKDMHRAYQAEDEREARERAEWEAQAKAQEEQEAKERAEAEQAEFARWQHEQLHNEEWQREQFKKWQQEQERLVREEEERQEAQRQAEEKARRERERCEQEERERRQREQRAREQARASHRTILATREQSLSYLGLTYRATRADVMQAFRNKVKSAADGKGGYTIDMDFLVKVKEKALQ